MQTENPPRNGTDFCILNFYYKKMVFDSNMVILPMIKKIKFSRILSYRLRQGLPGRGPLFRKAGQNRPLGNKFK